MILHFLAVKTIQEADLSNLTIAKKSIDEMQQDFCFAVNGGDKELLSILMKGLQL